MRRRAVALARALASIFPLDDENVLELTLFYNYFDSLIEHAKTFFESVLDDLQRCNVQVLRQQIRDEKEKINWSEIYGRERRGIEVEKRMTILNSRKQWQLWRRERKPCPNPSKALRACSWRITTRC
jgi:hypothetical protein